MRVTLIILGLSLLLTACSRSDADLRRQVVGTWTREETSTMNIAPNGGYTLVAREPNRTNLFAGTWQIRNGVFILTLTNAPAAPGGSRVGTVELYTIEFVDDHQLVCQQCGQTITLTR
jgi:hypothetical protein